MTIQIVIGLILVSISTICYYFPNVLIDIAPIDTKSIPGDFYLFYNYKLAGSFLMTSVYCITAFLLTDVKKLVLKIFLCYLSILESVTFFAHIIDKFFRHQIFNGIQILMTLIIFTICLTFIISRAIRRPSTEKFEPSKTYIVRFLPKDNFGVINYIIRSVGHKAIYQDGKIYRFKRSSGTVEQSPVTYNFFDRPDISIKRTKPIKDIEKIIGRKYNLITYNCNSLSHNANRS